MSIQTYTDKLELARMDTDTPDPPVCSGCGLVESDCIHVEFQENWEQDDRGKWCPVIAEAAEVGFGYRLINDFETIEEGDQYLDDNDRWVTTGEWGVCKGSAGFYRRKMSNSETY
jgi:hypothetical protein